MLSAEWPCQITVLDPDDPGVEACKASTRTPFAEISSARHVEAAGKCEMAKMEMKLIGSFPPAPDRRYAECTAPGVRRARPTSPPRGSLRFWSTAGSSR